MTAEISKHQQELIEKKVEEQRKRFEKGEI